MFQLARSSRLAVRPGIARPGSLSRHRRNALICAAALYAYLKAGLGNGGMDRPVGRTYPNDGAA